MRYPGFCSGSYQSQSPLADLERCVNWYVEQIEPPDAPWSTALYPTPGFLSWINTADYGSVAIGARALLSLNTRVHAVMGTNILELFANHSATIVGSVAADASPAQIVDNPLIAATNNQRLFASARNAYLLDLTTNVLTLVLVSSARMIGMMDTRFLAFSDLESSYRWSATNDGTSWPALNKNFRTIAADAWKAMLVDGNRQIWLIGEETGEVHYDTGTEPTPFQPIPGAVFGYGIIAPFSLKSAGDRVIWLSRSSNGAGIVVSARGYTPEPISTSAVETAIAGYARTASIADAEALVYQQEGHTFYCLSFPSVGRTWVYDLKTQVWHERGAWNSTANDYDVWAPSAHMYAFGQHIVGDRLGGLLFTMDVSAGYGLDTTGTPIRRVRIPPALWRDPDVRRMFVSRLQVFPQPGLGTVPATSQGYDPLMMLRVSTDGRTWSDERTASAGKMGVFDNETVWNRLPSSQMLWVPELSVTDPIPWRVMGADIDITGARKSAQAAA